MISCASRALRSASTRSLKTFGLFFLQLHHGVRFWRRFHSKRRLDLNLFIMDECLFKEWSLVIACGGRGYQRILVVQDKIYLIPLRGSVIFSWPSLPSPPLHWWLISNQLSTVPSPFILRWIRLTPFVWKLRDPAKIVHPLPPLPCPPPPDDKYDWPRNNSLFTYVKSFKVGNWFWHCSNICVKMFLQILFTISFN